MFYKLLTYLRFQVNSKSKSVSILPFLDTEIPQKKLELHNQYREELVNNRKHIKVTDFGAGSTIFSSDVRQISKIAKVAGIDKKNSENLMKIVAHYQPKNILEIGTSLGLATAAMGLENLTTNITTLEGCPETAKVAQEMFTKFNLKNININVGNFSETLPKSVHNKEFDLIYFDGNHQKEATLNYFETCLSTINNNSIFIFDDIHWSKPMEKAWNIIKQHPKVTKSVDTFNWGIVFFNPQKIKQHYTVRI